MLGIITTSTAYFETNGVNYISSACRGRYLHRLLPQATAAYTRASRWMLNCVGTEVERRYVDEHVRVSPLFVSRAFLAGSGVLGVRGPPLAFALSRCSFLLSLLAFCSPGFLGLRWCVSRGG